MMVLIGLSWLVAWLLDVLFFGSTVAGVVKSMLCTAILFIIVGFVVGEKPWERRP